MSITKSLRISEEEQKFVKKLKEYLREPTEASVLNRIFETGLQKELAEVALKVYQESDKKVSLRTIAKDFNISPVYLYSLCFDRGITILEANEDDFREDLKAFAEASENHDLTDLLEKIEDK